MTMNAKNYAAELMARKPQGEYYLYTKMEEALGGLCGADAGKAVITGEARVTYTGKACSPETRAEACEMMVEMAGQQKSKDPAGCLYLDMLANVAQEEAAELMLPGGRANVSVTSSATDDKLSVVRLVLNVAAGAESDVVVRIHSTNALLVQTKVNVADNAQLRMVLLQDEADCRRVLTRTTVDLAANARADVKLVNLHPALARNEVRVGLQAEGAELTLDGLYTVENGEKVDNETLVEHLVGHCTSNQLFKGIAGDKGMMAFGGLIQVKPDAQKTAAVQTNRHMLASMGGKAYAKPQLEIYADDVKCSHGATTGQIDPAQLFYMQQRGIDEATARRLLSAAFLGEVVSRIGIDDIREEVSTRMLGEAE